MFEFEKNDLKKNIEKLLYSQVHNNNNNNNLNQKNKVEVVKHGVDDSKKTVKKIEIDRNKDNLMNVNHNTLKNIEKDLRLFHDAKDFNDIKKRYQDLMNNLKTLNIDINSKKIIKKKINTVLMSKKNIKGSQK